MTPIRGWAPRGDKLVARAPFGKWRTLTFLAALRHDRIDAPCVLDGPINGTSFTAYVEQFLVPTLSPGDVVIMDNLGSHKPVLSEVEGEQGRTCRHPRDRGQALVPAALLARPQSHRAGLRQAQAPAPQSC